MTAPTTTNYLSFQQHREDINIYIQIDIVYYSIRDSVSSFIQWDERLGLNEIMYKQNAKHKKFFIISQKFVKNQTQMETRLENQLSRQNQFSYTNKA